MWAIRIVGNRQNVSKGGCIVYYRYRFINRAKRIHNIITLHTFIIYNCAPRPQRIAYMLYIYNIGIMLNTSI